MSLETIEAHGVSNVIKYLGRAKNRTYVVLLVLLFNGDSISSRGEHAVSIPFNKYSRVVIGPRTDAK